MRGLILFLTLISTLHASPTTTPFNTLLGQIHTLEADIIQTTTDQRGKVLQVAYGHMALSRPGEFHWEIKKPIPQLIIINRQQMVVYDPDLEQATVRSLKVVQQQGGVLFLSDDVSEIEKNYTVTALSSQPSSFTLTPKSSTDQAFTTITVQFANGTLSAMHLADHLGRVTHIQLKNIHTNIALPGRLFVFNKPAQVEIVHAE